MVLVVETKRLLDIMESFDTVAFLEIVIYSEEIGVPPLFEPIVMRVLVVFDARCASPRRP